MLAFTLKDGQSFTVGDATIHVHQRGDGSFKIAVDAPPEMRILRSNAKCTLPRSEVAERLAKGDRISDIEMDLDARENRVTQ